jgi:hypothetical protein
LTLPPVRCCVTGCSPAWPIPQPGPIPPTHLSPPARAEPIWAQLAEHTGRRRDSNGVRRLHASASGQGTPSRRPLFSPARRPVSKPAQASRRPRPDCAACSAPPTPWPPPFVAWGATGAKLIPPGVSPSQVAHPPPIPVAWSPLERRRRLAPPPADRVRRRGETTAPVRLL